MEESPPLFCGHDRAFLLLEVVRWVGVWSVSPFRLISASTHSRTDCKCGRGGITQLPRLRSGLTRFKLKGSSRAFEDGPVAGYGVYNAPTATATGEVDALKHQFRSFER